MKRLVYLIIIATLILSLSGCGAATVGTTSVTTQSTTKATTQPTTQVTTQATTEATTKATTEATTAAKTTMPSVEDLKKICKTYDYKTVARSPDEYAKKFMKISGKIIQIIEEENTTGIRLAENSDYDKMWFLMYTRPEGAPRVLEDDIVTIYAYCTGLYSYKSTLGATISIPGAVAMQIVIKE